MKEQKWDDGIDSSTEIFEASITLVEDSPVEKEAAVGEKSQLTELRRRIEERMDSKRIALEYDYDELDDIAENFQ